MPPRSSAAPFLGFTILVFFGVVVAWEYRASYLPELDALVNRIAERYHLVPS
jgi:hypothetical protein